MSKVYLVVTSNGDYQQLGEYEGAAIWELPEADYKAVEDCSKLLADTLEDKGAPVFDCFLDDQGELVVRGQSELAARAAGG